MIIERIGRTTDRVIHGKLYPIERIRNGKVYVTDEEGRGFQASASANHWHVHVEHKGQLGAIDGRYAYTIHGDAPPMIGESDKEQLVEILNENQTTKKDEAPTMKIEETVLINGQRADELSVSNYAELIRQEQAFANQFKDIPQNETVKKLCNEHNENIKRLADLMDKYHATSEG